MSHESDGAALDLADSKSNEILYLRAVYRNFVVYLAGQYRNGNAVEIAGICDETLDHTGKLLGDVREAARNASLWTNAPH